MKARLALALAVVALMVLSVPAAADPFTLQNCATCQGSIYTVDTALFSSTATTQTFKVAVTIDSSLFNPGGNLSSPYYIADVAVQIASIVLPGGTVLLPGGSLIAASPGGLSSAGCNGSGAGWVCANSGPLASNQTGGTLNWLFTLTIPTGSLLDVGSLKVEYVNGQNQKVGSLLSERFTVSEPATMSLLASGLLLVGFGRLRRAGRRIR